MAQMAQTRRSTGFAADWPLLSALAKQDHARVAALCAEQPALAATAAPGNLMPLHIAAMLGDAESVPLLAAAGCPLDGKLTHDHRELCKWMNTMRQEAACKISDNIDLYSYMGSTPLGIVLQNATDAWSQPENKHKATAQALVAAGADVWPLVEPYAILRVDGYNGGYGGYTSKYIGTWLLPHLAEQYMAGQLMVSSRQLGTLVRLAYSAGQQALCEKILQKAVERQQPKLTVNDSASLLKVTVNTGRVSMLRCLLELGASPMDAMGSARVLAILAEDAVDVGRSNVLQLLLEAGAPVQQRLVKAIINKLEPPLLETLLKHGPIPVHPSPPTLGNRDWSCPVLMLLRIRPKYAQLPKVLHLAEMLAAHGYRPTVYKDVPATHGRPAMAEYDPLKACHESVFELEFSNRYTLLPFDPEGWAPAKHHKYPPALRAAFRAVLLAAGRGAGTGAGRRPRQEGSLLGSLPQELLLCMLHLAAAPLWVWVQ